MNEEDWVNQLQIDLKKQDEATKDSTKKTPPKATPEALDKSEGKQSEKNAEATPEQNENNAKKPQKNEKNEVLGDSATDSTMQKNNAENNENSSIENTEKATTEQDNKNAVETEEKEQQQPPTDPIEAEQTSDDPVRDSQFKKAEEIPPYEPKTTTGELADRTPKAKKRFTKLINLGISRSDKIKAKLCAKISGQHFAEYLGDEELKEALVEAIQDYLESMEVTEPTPFQALMFALFMWLGSGFGAALWDKYTITPVKPTEGKETTNEAPNYQDLKEVKEGRKTFDVHASTGMYNRTPKRTYIKVDLADETPSPIIQQWLKEGLNDKEICKKLYS